MKAAYYRQNLRLLLPAIAWLTPLLTLALYVLANPKFRNFGDLDNAKTREGNGVVVGITPTYTTNHGDTYPTVLRVRVDGQEADMDYRLPARVQPGDRVKVTYKVGKSGRIYIAHLGSPDL